MVYICIYIVGKYGFQPYPTLRVFFYSILLEQEMIDNFVMTKFKSEWIFLSLTLSRSQHSVLPHYVCFMSSRSQHCFCHIMHLHVSRLQSTHRPFIRCVSVCFLCQEADLSTHICGSP